MWIKRDKATRSSRWEENYKIERRLFSNWPLICHLFLGGHRISYTYPLLIDEPFAHWIYDYHLTINMDDLFSTCIWICPSIIPHNVCIELVPFPASLSFICLRFCHLIHPIAIYTMRDIVFNVCIYWYFSVSEWVRMRACLFIFIFIIAIESMLIKIKFYLYDVQLL